MRALAVTGKERSPLLPDVPTVAESGVPEYVYTVWFGLWAPKNTPKPIVEKLYAEIQKALADPKVKERIAADSGVPMNMPLADIEPFVKGRDRQMGGRGQTRRYHGPAVTLRLLKRSAAGQPIRTQTGRADCGGRKRCGRRSRARSSVLMSGAIRSSWFIATSSRISLRTSPWALRGKASTTCRCSGFVVPRKSRSSCVARIAFNESIEAGAGAAVRIRHDGDVAHLRVRAKPRRDFRRLADEPHAAAFAVGEIQAACDCVIDLLAGRHPRPGNEALARQHAAFGGGKRVGSVAALMFEEMPQILVAGDPK